MKELAIVIPVYNEEEAIGAVLDKWVAELDRLGIDYTINPYNDGSKDGSWDVILAKEQEYPGKVVGHNKANSGHGPTILQGYRDAAGEGYEWIFQIDSDDEMGPEGFAGLWENRDQYDFLVGTRDGRKQALPRKIISAVSRLSVRLFYGQGIWDVNTPYRLMRASAFQDVFRKIPSDTFAPNVIISGMAAKLKMRCYETRVPQHDRTTGEVSIKKWKLLKAAFKSFCQMTFFATDQKPGAVSMGILSGMIAFVFLLQMAAFWEPITGQIKSRWDSSVYLTVAQEMLRGALPYRDLFDHKGLYIYFIDELAILTNLALVEWVFFAITAFVLYRILLLVVRPRLALVLMVFWLVLLRSRYLIFGNTVEEFLLPAIVYGIYYFVALVKRKGKVDYLQTILLGVAYGWMTMLKLNYFSVFAATGIYLLWTLCSEKRFKDLFLVILCGLLGVLISFLPGIVYLWKNGLFSDFFNCYILFNMEYSPSLDVTRLKFILESRAVDIVFIPWLAALILFIKKQRCDDGDKMIVLFILVTLLIDGMMVWMRVQSYVYYMVALTLTAMLAWAMICKYSLPVAAAVMSRMKERQHMLYQTVAVFCFIFFIVAVCIGVCKLTQTARGIVNNENGYPKDERICDYLKQHDGKMVVIGNVCSYYRMYDARPDSRYLYQDPIAKISSKIREDFLNELAEKKPPLLFRPRRVVIPEYLKETLKNYRAVECLNGTTLYVYDVPEDAR